MFKQKLEQDLHKSFGIPVQIFKNQDKTFNQCALFYFPHDVKVFKKDDYIYFDMLVDVMINETKCAGKGIGWLSSRLDFESFSEDEWAEKSGDDTLGLKKYGDDEDYSYDPQNDEFHIAMTCAYTTRIEHNKIREKIKHFNINIKS